MNKFFFILIVFFAGVVRADQQRFEIDSIRRMSMQHQQTIKTFDTYARESLLQITGKSSFNGLPASQVVLDWILDPSPKLDQNLIYIRNKPFRAEFCEAFGFDEAEKHRIIKEDGRISLAFYLKPETQEKLNKLMASSTVKAKAIKELQEQAWTLVQILDYPNFRGTFMSQAIIPPLDSASANQKPWMTLAEASIDSNEKRDPALENYAEQLTRIILAINGLKDAWHSHDAVAIKSNSDQIEKITSEINPKIYPSLTKRNFEILYNSLARLTWPGAALYIVGLVFFMLAWNTQSRWMYVTAWSTTLCGFAVHLAAIVIRWWLVQKNIDSWWTAIPIKNQFESVMFSALFGVVVAMLLESGFINWIARKCFKLDIVKLHGHSIFGFAGAGIGMLSLIALFTVPYVTGADIIGGSIKQNAGILMTYWLYIHVTLVTCSYALIGMTFILGAWYTIQYLSNSDASVLKTLDTANLTMLQMAFWVLGIGIITGALWADVSWGRPWGWDPKETFALITWIVYLIIVHIRFVTAGENRALVTSVLSVIGFFVMLFNWIGVNFFLVGLHSYA